MAGIPITSIGAKISWAVEATAGTRPTTGYKHIPDLKEFPDTDAQPNTADATTFDNLEYTSYVNLLKDLGGSLTLRGNMTNALKTEWKAFYEAAKTAKAANKKAWICVDIPDYDEAVYIPADPANIGLSAFAANSLMEQDLHFTPTGDIVYDEKPTYAAASN